MVQRRHFIVLSATAVLMALTGCKKKQDSSILRVGMDLSYPPFEMQDHSGRPDGVSVKLAEALAAHMGRQVEIVPMDFSGLIPALKTGNIDLIISSMTATAERRKSITFSEPYAFTGLALLVGKNSRVQSVKDLEKPGTTIAVKTGTTGDSWALEHLPQTKRVVFDDPSSCVLEVSQGRADAFIYDQLSILKYSAQNPETTRGLLEPFVTESWSIGIDKGDTAMEQKVNAFLKDFRKTGGFQKLGEQYLSEEKSRLEAAGIPFLLR